MQTLEQTEKSLRQVQLPISHTVDYDQSLPAELSTVTKQHINTQQSRIHYS